MKDNPSDHFVIIPPVVLADKKLTLGQKVVFGRVFGLTKSKGYCYASNDYLAESIGISKNTVKKYLVKLYKTGYLRHSMVYDKKTQEVIERRIYPTLGYQDIIPLRNPRVPEYPSRDDIENKEEDNGISDKRLQKIRAEIYKKVGKSMKG